jgi:hypothetical protein
LPLLEDAVRLGLRFILPLLFKFLDKGIPSSSSSKRGVAIDTMRGDKKVGRVDNHSVKKKGV